MVCAIAECVERIGVGTPGRGTARAGFVSRNIGRSRADFPILVSMWVVNGGGVVLVASLGEAFLSARAAAQRVRSARAADQRPESAADASPTHGRESDEWLADD